MARDPTPSIILRQQGYLAGWLWASGIFSGFNDFLREEHISLIINCLRRGKGDILDMNSIDGCYMERVRAALPKVAYALACGKAVLVHCAHGIHRTGSFVVFFMALMLRLAYTRENSNWDDWVALAWTFWSHRRDVESRNFGNHDLVQESWTAFQDYFGDLDREYLDMLALRMAQQIQRAFDRLTDADKFIREFRRIIVLSSDAPKVPEVKDVHEVLKGVMPQPKCKARPKRDRDNIDVPDVIEVESDSTQEEKKKKKVNVVLKPNPAAPPPPPPPPTIPALTPQPPSEPPRWSGSSVVQGESSEMPWRPFLKGDWRCRECNNHNMHWRGYCFGLHGRCRATRDASFRNGDWYCQCGNFNLQRRTHCNRRKCGASRQDAEQFPPSPP